MNINVFLIMLVINFFFLSFVSMCILYVLKKKDTASRDDVVHLVQQEQQKLQEVLSELSNVATIVYGDIENKEKKLRQLLDEANEKIVLFHATHSNPSIIEGKNGNVSKRKEPTHEKSSVHNNSSTIHDNENKKIFELADQGFSILDIAKMVNKPKGEIELMLHLQKVREGHYVTG